MKQCHICALNCIITCTECSVFKFTFAVKFCQLLLLVSVRWIGDISVSIVCYSETYCPSSRCILASSEVCSRVRVSETKLLLLVKFYNCIILIIISLIALMFEYVYFLSRTCWCNYILMIQFTTFFVCMYISLLFLCVFPLLLCLQVCVIIDLWSVDEQHK